MILPSCEQMEVDLPYDREQLLSELKAEKEKNQRFQEELNRMNALCSNFNQLHQAYINTSQLASYLRQTLAKEVKERHLLQSYYVELQSVHEESQEKFSADLLLERERNSQLQEELDKTKASHQDLSLRYHTDVFSVRQQLQKQLQKKDLSQKHHQALPDARTSLQMEKEKNKAVQAEPEQPKASHPEISQRFQTDVATFKQQVDTRQLDQEIKSYSDSVLRSHQVLSLCYHTDDFSVQKQLQEKDLSQKHHPDLPDAPASLQMEKEENKAVQEEPEKPRVSDVATIKQQGDTVMHQLDQEVKSHADSVTEGQHVTETLKAEQDAVSSSATSTSSEVEVAVQRTPKLKDRKALKRHISAELEEDNDDQPPCKKTKLPVPWWAAEKNRKWCENGEQGHLADMRCWMISVSLCGVSLSLCVEYVLLNPWWEWNVNKVWNVNK